jgi:5-methylcytosine-specific restriction protein A
VPSAPPRACPKCGKAHDEKGAYCSDCRTAIPSLQQTEKPWANHASYAETKKREPWSALYDLAVWRGKHGLRAKVLAMAENAICCICHRAPSTVADHIVPHKGDRKLFFDLKNLQGACKPCHDAKSAREKQEARSLNG